MIAVFAGTSEGRLAVDLLKENSLEVVCFNATSYGGSLYKDIKVYGYPMDLETIQSKLLEHKVTDIIDCTHPFAEVISTNLMSASTKLKIPYYRYERPYLESEHYDHYDDILRDINKTEGNIFLTIGSNNLELFTENVDIKRLYCRVLPTEVVIKKCYELGLTPKQIIGMQGPFDTQLNRAMFHTLDIKHLVTKASGDAGGFKEKLGAAKVLNIHTYVLGRPQIEYVNLYKSLETLIKEISEERK
ncbi:MAG: precorrin-6A reductase [Clostridiales bacterium]|nr:precorrin-6A reductase [Clostridiales bacterium]